jgi:uncharacterized protein YceK
MYKPAIGVQMKKLFVIFCAVVLSACGTVTTLGASDGYVSEKLTSVETYCETLPRVYSGATYDICLLHSNPDKKRSGFSAPFYLLDATVSAVFDTVALPYSIYAQSEHGSLELAR